MKNLSVVLKQVKAAIVFAAKKKRTKSAEAKKKETQKAALKKLREKPDLYRKKMGKCPPGYRLGKAGKCVPSGKPEKKVKKPEGKAAPVKDDSKIDKIEKDFFAKGEHKPGVLRKGLGHAWHMISDPFKKAHKLATSGDYRKEVKDHVMSSIKKEVGETKAMAGTFKKMLQGQTASLEERKAALHQLADIVKTAVVASTVSAVGAHLAAGGVAKLVASLASPIDEIIGIALDKPMRALSKKLFKKEHGLLPTSFYESHEAVAASISASYKEGDEMKLIGKIVDAMLEELSGVDLDDDALEAALAKAGLKVADKAKIEKALGGGHRKKAMLEAAFALVRVAEELEDADFQRARQL